MLRVPSGGTNDDPHNGRDLASGARRRFLPDCRRRCRNSISWPLAGLSNPVTQLLLCLGFAKLCRVPVITDDLINPRLRDFTGVANIMSLAGMTWAALIAIPLMGIAAYITGGVQFSARLQLLQAGLIVGVMTIAFLYSPMADQPTSYMTSDFPVTGSVLLYWLAFLLPILTSCGVTAYHCAASLLLVRRGLLARALGALFCAAVIGISTAHTRWSTCSCSIRGSITHIRNTPRQFRWYLCLRRWHSRHWPPASTPAPNCPSASSATASCANTAAIGSQRGRTPQ